MERQSQQLKEIIVEKQIKAEKLREEHLKKIQSKAKEEKAKVEEIALTSQIKCVGVLFKWVMGCSGAQCGAAYQSTHAVPFH